MTEEDVVKIEDLNNGKFTVIAKVTSSETGSADKKFLQRGRLGDETGSIDFVIYGNAQLDPLEDGKVYKFTNAYASNNTGFLTLRPNKRIDGCTVSLVEEDFDVNPSLIFRDKGSIPSVLTDETHDSCSMIFNHIINEKFDPHLSITEKALNLATYHDIVHDRYNKRVPISYNEAKFQDGYMFGFFPFFIGMIYHLLREVEFENPSDIFHDDMKICLYGCGPAPEILGFTAYIRDFHPDVRRIDVTFFDQNVWDYWRDYCITELLPLYWDGKLQSHSYDLDLLKYPESVGEEIIQAITLASIHNFQNVVSDLYQNPKNLERLGHSFFNLYRQTPSGSIMILSDQYYGETKRIFERISYLIKTQHLGTTLLEPDLVQNYKREFDTPQPMKDIGHFYKKYMGFYGMILKRT
jgi:hypothetical protein